MQTRRLTLTSSQQAPRRERPSRRRPLLSFRRFLGCRSGSSALEFALAIPVFILMVAGVIEISMVTFVSILAEGGLREASRYGITGQAPTATSREAQIVQIVQDHTHNLITVSSDNVTFKTYGDYGHIGSAEPFEDANGNGEWDEGETYTDWNGNGSWDEDSGTAGSGGAGDIVVYEVTYQWAFITPLFKVFGGDDGALDLTASITVRNEPWDPSGDAT